MNNQPPEGTPPQLSTPTPALPTSLTTVTPLSKYLAMALFVVLPFVGFWVGMGYGGSFKGVVVPVVPVPPTILEPSGDVYTMSDDQIREVVYSDYFAPAGFYSEYVERDPTIHDSTYYLWDVTYDGEGRQFACATSMDSATLLVQADLAAYHAQDPEIYERRTVIETTETSMFYEFKTLEKHEENDHTYYLRYRVYKCEYLSGGRQMLGSSQLAGGVYQTIGVYGGGTNSERDMRTFAEHVWYRDDNFGGSKVLHSQEGGWTKGNEKYQHIINAVQVSYGDFGVCDDIQVYRTSFEFNPRGDVQVNKEVLKTIRGTCR